MSIESIVQSLEAAEAHKLAEERRSRAELGELLAAMDERERRKSGLSPEEWADLKRETASAVNDGLLLTHHQRFRIDPPGSMLSTYAPLTRQR